MVFTTSSFIMIRQDLLIDFTLRLSAFFGALLHLLCAVGGIFTQRLKSNQSMTCNIILKPITSMKYVSSCRSRGGSILCNIMLVFATFPIGWSKYYKSKTIWGFRVSISKSPILLRNCLKKTNVCAVFIVINKYLYDLRMQNKCYQYTSEAK